MVILYEHPLLESQKRVIVNKVQIMLAERGKTALSLHYLSPAA